MLKPGLHLVDDPTLRDSLRRLYPAYTPTVQAWIITDPGVPLPALFQHTLPTIHNIASLEAQLHATLEMLRDRHPSYGWFVGPCQDSTNPEFRGLWVQCRAGGQKRLTAIDELPDNHVFAYQYARTPGVHQSEVRGQTWLTAPRHAGIASTQFGVFGPGPFDFLCLQTRRHLSLLTPIAFSKQAQFVWRRNLDEVFADGSPEFLAVAHTPMAPHALINLGLNQHQVKDSLPAGMFPRRTTSHPWNALPPEKYDLYRDRLLMRWLGLESTQDRVRIANFWAKHQHPVLSAAGRSIGANIGHVPIQRPTLFPRPAEARA